MTKVLLIEDNPGDAYLVRKALSKAEQGFTVEHVSRLTDGLQHPDLESFNVILSDLSLPDSCGLQSVTVLRQRLPTLPLIVLTSSENDILAKQSLDLGAQDYLVKDHISTDVLRHAIHYAIQRQLVVAENLKLLRRLEDGKNLLRRKNRRLRQLNRTAQQFVDNVSHEFRTPLTVIKEYASLIIDGIVGDVNHEQQRMLNVVMDRADDMNTMVDDLLDMSRLKAGLLGARRELCHVSDVLRHVLPNLERKARVRGVVLETNVDSQLPVVYCDGEKLGRVLINLAVNAIKFCGQAGTVQVWAKDSPNHDEVVIGVTDNGPGIDEAQLNVIFERFRQLNTESKSNTKGFGLGLDIAKQLVDVNLGTMNVESIPGKGSTFSFTVPHADPVEVTSRYLSQIAVRRHKSAIVSLVNAELDEDACEKLCNEVDTFHSHLLRRNDMVFRGGQRRWLFVLLNSELELDQFFSRVEETRTATNRNRPSGPLPSVRYTVDGSWPAGAATEEILSRIAASVSTAESCSG